jgi:hypothetical protein
LSKRSSSPTLGTRKRSVLFLVAAFIFSASTLSFSADKFYVSQSGGTLTCNGASQSTQPAAFFNSPSNWASPKVSGKIGPGDTVILCGTISGSVNGNILTVQGSGSSGNPITIQWDSSALLTSSACSSSNGCFSTNRKSWLIVDGGGTDPSVTSTASGTNLANQANAWGINGQYCNNCEFRNLSVTNMYVFVGPNDANENGVGISVACTSNTSVHDSSFDQMASPISDGFCDGDTADSFYNNTLDHFNHGIEIGNNGTQRISNFSFYGNHLKNMSNWDTTNDYHHHDGIFFYQNTAVSNTVTNFYIYNNLADGDLGVNATAWVYYNSGLNGIYLFNNSFFNPQGRGVALVEGGYTGDQNFYVYNNYMDCGGQTNGARAFQYGNGGTAVTGFSFANNAIHNCGTYLDTNGVIVGSGLVDHNVYESACSGGGCFKWNNGGGQTYSQYQASTGNDSHSLTPSSVGANSIGQPQSGSAMIHDGTVHFENLASSCQGLLTPLCTDSSGTPRASSGQYNWEAGAYVYGSGAPAPPTGLAAVVQ